MRFQTISTDLSVLKPNLVGSTECAADITWADFRALSAAEGGEAGRRARATSSIAPVGVAIARCGFLVLDPDTLVEARRAPLLLQLPLFSRAFFFWLTHTRA